MVVIPRYQVKTPGHPVCSLLLEKSSLALELYLAPSSTVHKGLVGTSFIKHTRPIQKLGFLILLATAEIQSWAVSVLKGLLENILNKDYSILLI